MASDSSQNVDCELRNGHCEGHTVCCYHTNGKNILTCGVDSEVRVWPIDDTNDDDTESFPISDQAFGIVCNSTNFYVACDGNAVKSYSLTDGENELSVCRFTANATHIDMSADGNHLVASAADFTFKHINLEKSTQKNFEGHEAPILCVSLDPKLKYIASSSCDGSIRIWNIDSQKCAHIWTNCYPKSNDLFNSLTLAFVSWQPIYGQLIALPKQEQIEIYHRETWDLVHTYKNDKLSNISIASYSHDSNYIAAANNIGTIMIWSTKTTNASPIAIFFHFKSCKISCLKWNPKVSKQFCFCDVNGQFGIVNISVSNASKKDNDVGLTQQELDCMFAELSDDDFGKDDCDADNNKEKQVNDELPKITFSPNKIVDKRKLSKTKKKSIDEQSINSDDNDLERLMDIGAIKSQYEPLIFGDESMDEKCDREVVRQTKEIIIRDPLEAPPLRQQPFQIGSTPTHLSQRYMVWNSVGIVLSSTTESDGDQEKSIDVEFHDSNTHHSIHLSNVYDYTFADLSNEALILANNRNDDTSKLFCMLFNSWDATKEWQIEMPKNECIEAITIGLGFIAVATDKRFIRILTIGGIQTNLFSIAGPLLCLSSYEHYLMVIYHMATGFPEDQNLSMYILNVDHKNPVVRHPVPTPIAVALSPKSQLSWAGFTDEGTACVADLDGIIRVLKNSFGNTWIPIADTTEHTKGKSDHYFIIGLSEIRNQIRCIFCKGAQYPTTLPKPNVVILPLQMPICELFTAKGKHEEEQIRNKLMVPLLKKLSKDGFEVDSLLEDCNRKVINSLIKLFALALGAQRESLALEIAYLMPNRVALEGAIKYAERQRHISLAQKISEIAEQKLHQELNECAEQSEEEEEIEITHVTKNNVETQSSYDTCLKPKAMKKRSDITIEDTNSNFAVSDSDNDESVRVSAFNSNKEESNDIGDNSNDNSNSHTLKPKSIKDTLNNFGNPFKVASSKCNKRKKHNNQSDNDSEESENDISYDIGFKLYLEEHRQQISEDNSDSEEKEVIKIAKKQFQQLDQTVRKLWLKKAKEKPDKRRAKRDRDESKKKHKSDSNSITTFFKRN